ncbi:MAG: hypothetical protein KDI44_18175 [Thiothrix sp.]|nr:hypothetical protein [Thiothrix sp.]HPQ96778.1 hypothetical protein [Thiolinea sp.]
MKLTKSMIENQEPVPPVPSATMPRYWWEVMAIIYEFGAQRRQAHVKDVAVEQNRRQEQHRADDVRRVGRR